MFRSCHRATVPRGAGRRRDLRRLSEVSTFLNTLHVLAAVLLVGPLVAIPFAARRAITRRSAYGVRVSGNLLALFGAGSLLVAGLGVATVLADDQWELTTPWVLIATTLYGVALGLIWVYAVPALRRAAHLLAAAAEPVAGGPAVAEPVAGGPAVAEPVAGGPVAGGDPEPGAGPEPGGGPEPEPVAAAAPATPAPAAPERVYLISARVAGAGWLLLVTFAAITILMTTRPA
jgi:uncharacterized membrane protein